VDRFGVQSQPEGDESGIAQFGVMLVLRCARLIGHQPPAGQRRCALYQPDRWNAGLGWKRDRPLRAIRDGW
jgi:hypothetical protein